MKTAFVLATLLVFACSGLALAEDKIEDALPPEEAGSGLVPCNTEGYKRSSADSSLAIPDNNAAGVSSTITLTEAGTILDAVVGIELSHSWVGDLVASLSFQPACGGASVGPVRLLCRQNRTTGCFGTSGFGCSANLGTISDYEWSDDAAAEMGEPTCPSSTTIIATGCYKPDDDNAGVNFPLSVFDGLDKNGCWTLTVTDNAGGDTGTLVSWSLSLNNEIVQTEACCLPDGSCVDAVVGQCPAGSTPQGSGTSCATVTCVNATESRSWGGVKGLYR